MAVGLVGALRHRGHRRRGHDQAPLRYVDADAERVRSVLEEVGSVDAGHLLRVSNATPETLRAALATAESALRGNPDGC